MSGRKKTPSKKSTASEPANPVVENSGPVAAAPIPFAMPPTTTAQVSSEQANAMAQQAALLAVQAIQEEIRKKATTDAAEVQRVAAEAAATAAAAALSEREATLVRREREAEHDRGRAGTRGYGSRRNRDSFEGTSGSGRSHQRERYSSSRSPPQRKSRYSEDGRHRRISDPMTVKEVRKYIDNIVNYGDVSSTTRSAEIRRHGLSLVAVSEIYYDLLEKGSDTEVGPDWKTLDKLAMKMELDMEMIRGLVAFEKAPANMDLQQKVTRLENQIINAAMDVSEEVGSMAKNFISAGPVASRVNSFSGAGGSGRGRAVYGKAAAQPEKEEKSTIAENAAQLRVKELEQQLSVMTRVMGGMPQSNNAATPTAAVLPTYNQQFQGPRAAPGQCHVCMNYGHYAKFCPKNGSHGAAAANNTQVSKRVAENSGRGANTQHQNASESAIKRMPLSIEETNLKRQGIQSSKEDLKVLGPGGTDVGGKPAYVIDLLTTVSSFFRPQRVLARDSRNGSENGRSDSGEREMEVSADHLPVGVKKCKCGYCGECTIGIDLLQKEQRKSLAIAKNPAAKRVEESMNELEALLAKFDVNPNTMINQQLNDLYTKELQSESWSVEDGDEDSDPMPSLLVGLNPRSAEEEGGPPESPIRLREIMAQGKKCFDKYALWRICNFCHRKGHTTATCMIKPGTPASKDPTQKQTPLQLAKERFVLELMARPKAREVDTFQTENQKDRKERMSAVKHVMAMGEEANRGNPWKDSTKRRDKLRKQLGYWWAIGADPIVLSWIGFGVRLRFEEEPVSRRFPNHRSYWQEKEHIEKEHETHVEDGSFRIGADSEVKIGNPVQVEVNAKGKRRQCIDMRYTNRHLADYQFTQETLEKHVALIVQRYMLMITTDVAKAYYQVPLHKESQPYCAWRHNGKWVIPTVLTFGISIAPFVFTKIMRVVLRFMRALTIRGSNCIDDNLWAETKEAIEEVKEIVQLVFGLLGWAFNEKCSFTPSTIALYNGMWIDSERFEIRATDEKIEAARRLAWTIWYSARDGIAVRLLDLQRLAGRLQSMRLALEGVAVWTRGLYMDVTRGLKECRERGESMKSKTLLLSELALEDVNFWSLRLGKQNGLPINDRGNEVHLTFFSDASDVGYGAHEANGLWKLDGQLPAEVLGESSTAREITGVILAAARQAELLKTRRVRICMDSYPAIRNLINGGGSKMDLNVLVVDLVQSKPSNALVPMDTKRGQR